MAKSCSEVFREILNGTTDICSLTPEELRSLYHCLNGSKLDQELMLAMLQQCTTATLADGSTVEANIVPGDEAAVITSGTTNTVPAGANSVLIVKTNSGDSTGVAGQSLTTENASLSLEAPPGKFLPEITITPVGASTHAWTAIT